MAIDQDAPNENARRIQVKEGTYSLQGWHTSDDEKSVISADQARLIANRNQRWRKEINWIYERIRVAAEKGERNTNVTNLAYDQNIADHLDANGYSVEVLNSDWNISW